MPKTHLIHQSAALSLPLLSLTCVKQESLITASSRACQSRHSMQKPGANLIYHWGDATDKHQPCQDGGDPWGKLTCNPLYSDLLPLWKCSQILWGKGFILPSKLYSLLLNRSNHIFSWVKVYSFRVVFLFLSMNTSLHCKSNSIQFNCNNWTHFKITKHEMVLKSGLKTFCINCMYKS